MRTLFTIAALVLALAVVGLLARQPLARVAPASGTMPSAPGVAPPMPGAVSAQPPAQQVQQVQQAVEVLVQQPRSLPDEAK